MKRIFLIGSPRSGTTLLQSMIGCSPDIVTFKESHLFSRSFSVRHTALPAHRSPLGEVTRFFEENEIGINCLPPDLSASERLSREAVAAYFLEALDNAGSSSGKCAWLEKTPRHLLYTDLIEKAAAREGKDVHFIHLIRDGVSVAASMSNASQLWQKKHDAEAALKRWQKEIAITRSKCGNQNHTVAVYEDLLHEPTTTMTKLAKRLGLRLSREDLARRNEVLESIVRADESWKLDTAGQRVKPLDRTSKHISDEQREQLQSVIDYTDYHYLLEVAHSAMDEVMA